MGDRRAEPRRPDPEGDEGEDMRKFLSLWFPDPRMEPEPEPRPSEGRSSLSFTF